MTSHNFFFRFLTIKGNWSKSSRRSFVVFIFFIIIITFSQKLLHITWTIDEIKKTSSRKVRKKVIKSGSVIKFTYALLPMIMNVIKIIITIMLWRQFSFNSFMWDSDWLAWLQISAVDIEDDYYLFPYRVYISSFNCVYYLQRIIFVCSSTLNVIKKLKVENYNKLKNLI